MAGGKSLSSLNFILGANIKDFQTGMRKASDELKLNGKQFKKFGKEMATNVTLPLVGVVAGIAAVTMKSAEFAESMHEMQIKTGLAVETLQELKFIGSQSGIEMESLQKAVVQLYKKLGAADSGTEKTVNAFSKLGVNIYGVDGRLRGINDLFPEIIGALTRMDNQTERNALSFQLFGRGAMDIVPQLSNLGESGMRELTLRAHELGLVMGEESVEKFANFKHAMDATHQQLQAVGRDLAVSLADVFTQKVIPVLQSKVIPAIRSLGKWFLDLSPATQKFIMIATGVTAAIAPMAIAIGWLSATVIPGLIAALKWLTTAFSTMIASIVANPYAWLIGALAVVVTSLVIFKKRTNEAATAQHELGTAIEGVNEAVGKQLWDQLVNKYEIGADGAAKMTGSVDNLRDAMVKMTRGELESLKAFLETQFSAATRDAADQTNSLNAQLGAQNALDYKNGLAIVNAELNKFQTANDDAVEPVVELKDEISALEKKLMDEIMANDANVLSTARLLRAKREQKKVYEDLANTLTTSIPKMKPLTADIQVDATAGINANPPVSDLMPTRDDIGVIDTFSEKYAGMGNVVVDTNSVMASGLSDMGTMIGEVFGQLIAGTATMGDVFMGILQIVAKFIRSFGEALLAAAVGAIAFEQLLANPYAAAAAGVALIALASVVTSVMSKGLTGGGSSGGGGATDYNGGGFESVPRLAGGAVVGKPMLAMVGDNYNPIGDNPEIITPFRKLESWFHSTVLGASDGMRQNASTDLQPVIVDVRVDGQMRGDTIYFTNKRFINRLKRGT
jgi:hypothetical protein